MGEKRVRIIDVARATGISRNMLSMLYYDRARRVDLDDLAKLCKYFNCSVGEILEAEREDGASRSVNLRSQR